MDEKWKKWKKWKKRNKNNCGKQLNLKIMNSFEALFYLSSFADIILLSLSIEIGFSFIRYLWDHLHWVIYFPYQSNKRKLKTY